jgi:hypothetical protein
LTANIQLVASYQKNPPAKAGATGLKSANVNAK